MAITYEFLLVLVVACNFYAEVHSSPEMPISMLMDARSIYSYAINESYTYVQFYTHVFRNDGNRQVDNVTIEYSSVGKNRELSTTLFTTKLGWSYVFVCKYQILYPGSYYVRSKVTDNLGSGVACADEAMVSVDSRGIATLL